MSDQQPSNRPSPRDTCCSFCCKNSREVGPLVEAPDQVAICYAWVRLCAAIIEQECELRGVPLKEYHD
jgi:hypothetical protein